MYRSHCSASRGKRQSQSRLVGCTSSVNLLYNGLRRKISETEYRSIYPKMRLTTSQASQVSSFSVMKNQYAEEYIYDEVMRMREENRRISDENIKLKTNIRRQNKINDLFQKRREDGPLQAMGIQKLMEMKLILEVEQLEQILIDSQLMLKEVQQKQKDNKNSVDEDIVDTKLSYWQAMSASGQDLEPIRQQKEHFLYKLSDKLNRIKLQTRKSKQVQKKKYEEIAHLQETIQKDKKALPSNFNSNMAVSDSGGLSLQNKNKTIEDIQREIEELRLKCRKVEVSTQEQIDFYVKQKILMHKEIDQLKLLVDQSSRWSQEWSIW